MSIKFEPSLENVFVRCPKCLKQWQPYQFVPYYIISDGDDSIKCVRCEHEFTLDKTVIQYLDGPEFDKYAND